MSSPRRATRGGLAAVAGRVLAVASAVALVAYPVAVYVGMTHWDLRYAAAALILLVAPAAVSRLRRTGGERVRAVALIPLLTVLLLGVGAVLNASGFALAVPAAVNGLLLGAFGTTLWNGPPMIERFARLVDPDLGPAEVRWCRRWTGVWCGFFALNGATAAALAVVAPVAWWAVYNGLVAYVLMGVLLGAEWVLRKLRFGRLGGSLPERVLRSVAWGRASSERPGA
ncbi:MAG: hypothetical protein ACODAU_07560 [Myxococcota bacterium]